MERMTTLDRSICPIYTEIGLNRHIKKGELLFDTVPYLGACGLTGRSVP